MSAPVYTALGKEVLRDGRHFLGATSTEIAEAIAMVLNGIADGAMTPAQAMFCEKVLWG